MHAAEQSVLVASARARSIKRKNALTAILCGSLPALLLSLYVPSRPGRWVIGLAIGLVWANAFEYFYHRYLLHWTKTSFGQGHLLHHSTVGTPQEAEHVTFGESPRYVALLFVINGLPVLAFESLGRVGIGAGILLGFTCYFVLVEEIHWRIHLGGWLPWGLCAARDYHIAHHDIPDGCFNVYLPLCDVLFGTFKPAPLPAASYSSRRAATRPLKPRILTWLFEEIFLYILLAWISLIIRYYSQPSGKA